MQTIYLPHLLRQPRSTQQFEVDGMLPSLETLTPVRGTITVRHGGTFLEVTAIADTIVNLTCDRCAQSYNQRLHVDTQEILWLQETSEVPMKTELELNAQNLSESLDPHGHFDPEEWLYEQLCLILPLQNLCGKDCQPPALPAPEQLSEIDDRWAALKQLIP